MPFSREKSACKFPLFQFIYPAAHSTGETMKGYLFFAAALFSPAFAFASSDNCYDSGQALYLHRPALDDCSTDLNFLDPFNDSRGNIALMIGAYVTTRDDQSDESPFEREVRAAESEGIRITRTAPTPHFSIEEYAAVFGTCHSNNKDAAAHFISMIRQSSLSNDLKGKLIDIRILLLAECGAKGDFVEWAKPENPDLGQLESNDSTKEWLHYLRAAFLLYHSNPKEAADIFASLKSSSDPHLKETALYLEGRTRLVQAQTAWDGYNRSSESVDRATVEAGARLLQEYVSTFPKGPFAASATGLIRRAARLLDKNEEYLSLLFKAFNEGIEKKDALTLGYLGDELERFVSLWSSRPPFDSPLLAAQSILMMNRDPITEDQKNAASETLKKLEENAALFAPYRGLHDLLQSQMLFRMQRFEEAAASMPPASAPEEVKSAHKLVAAESLEFLGKFDEAEKLWRELIAGQKSKATAKPEATATPEQSGDSGEEIDSGPSIQLENSEIRLRIALLRNLLRSKKFGAIAESGLEDLPGLNLAFLQVYTDEELEKVLETGKASEPTKAAATEALLYHFMMDENFESFVKLFDRASEEVKQKFADVEKTIHALAKNRQDPRALLDFGHFQENFYDGAERAAVYFKPIDLSEKSGNPGSILAEFFGKEGFRGSKGMTKDLRPFDYYQEARDVLAKLPKADADLKAEALFRLIWCFRWSTCHVHIPNDLVPKKQRSAWFNELKSKYKNSSWAQETKYYY